MYRPRLFRYLHCLLAALALAACNGAAGPPQPGPQPTSTATATAAATSTPMPSATPLPPATAVPTATPLPPTPRPPATAYEDLRSPATLLASFYNALNLKEYERAYRYLGQAPAESYPDFVARYAAADTIDLALIPPTWLEGAAGSTYSAAPLFLRLATLDGTRQFQQGCATLRYPHQGPGGGPPTGNWRLDRLDLAAAPGEDLDPARLATLCAQGPSPLGTAYDDTAFPGSLIASLFDAVNRKDYRRAYGYWQNPPLLFDQFAAGYADTEQVILTLSPPAYVGVAAGSSYSHVPVFLLAIHTDGRRHAFLGCYTTRQSNVAVNDQPPDPAWRIYDAVVEPHPDETVPIDDLLLACSLD